MITLGMLTAALSAGADHGDCEQLAQLKLHNVRITEAATENFTCKL
jgi:hypothetical protein